MRQYRIVPNEVIKEGDLNYKLDPDEKTLSYALHAVVKKWLFTKEINKLGTQVVDPNDFLSDKFKHVGKGLKFGPLSILIQSVKNNVAKADIRSELGNLRGHATYDLSEQYVSLLTVQAEGSLMGVAFKLNIQPKE